METLLSTLKNLMEMLAGFCSNTENQALIKIVTKNFPKAYTTCNSSDLVQTLFNIVMPIGLVVFIIYYCVDLMSKAAAANFTTETFVRSLIRFVIGYALITNCYKLSTGIISFGDAIVADLVNAIGSTDSLSVDYGLGLNVEDVIAVLAGDTSKTGLTLMQTLNLTGKVLIQLILNLVINIAVIGIAYSRAIKIIVYQIFLPLSVADIFGGGLYGGGVSHIKKLLAAVLQYPIVYIIVLITIIFMNNTSISMFNWFAYMGQIFMIAVCVVKEINNSASTANELFG